PLTRGSPFEGCKTVASRLNTLNKLRALVLTKPRHLQLDVFDAVLAWINVQFVNVLNDLVIGKRDGSRRSPRLFRLGVIQMVLASFPQPQTRQCGIVGCKSTLTKPANTLPFLGF